MGAELLREASRAMRERAQAATSWSGSADWFPSSSTVQSSGGWVVTASPRTVEHIASWSPVVALAVADWLERVALTAAEVDLRDPLPNTEAHDALAVARAYLGRDQ